MKNTLEKAWNLAVSVVVSLRGLIFIAVILFVFLGIPPHVFFQVVLTALTEFFHETAKVFDLRAIQEWFRFMIF
jgi:hypothetical protein